MEIIEWKFIIIHFIGPNKYAHKILIFTHNLKHGSSGGHRRMGRGGGGHVPPKIFYGRAKSNAKFGQNFKNFGKILICPEKMFVFSRKLCDVSIGSPKIRVEIFTLARRARACIESTQFILFIVLHYNKLSRLDACLSATREGKNFNTYFWAAYDVRGNFVICPENFFWLSGKNFWSRI